MHQALPHAISPCVSVQQADSRQIACDNVVSNTLFMSSLAALTICCRGFGRSVTDLMEEVAHDSQILFNGNWMKLLSFGFIGVGNY